VKIRFSPVTPCNRSRPKWLVTETFVSVTEVKTVLVRTVPHGKWGEAFVLKKGDPNKASDTEAEAYSYRFLEIIASASQISYNRLDQLVDNDGIDSIWTSYGAQSQASRPKFQAQVKSARGKTAIRVRQRDEANVYNLDRSDFNKLMVTDLIPRLLIVVQIPELGSEWIDCHDEGHLMLMRRAYWKDPQKVPSDCISPTTVRIELFSQDLLTPKSIRLLMEKIANGEIRGVGQGAET